MAVEEGRIQVGVKDEWLDTSKVDQPVSGISAHRESVVITDPETFAARQKVTNSDAVDTDYGSVVRPAPSVNDDILLAVPAGLITGVSSINKFGSGTVGGAADETIWDGTSLTGITNYTYMADGATLYLSSDAAGDDQVYEVQGLDATYAAQTVNVTANGVTFVELTGTTWSRVFRVKNLGATDNAGNIYISDDNTDAGGNGIPDTLTNVKAMIGIGNNQTLMAIYTVPTGCTAYITQWAASAGKGDDVEVTMWARPTGGVFQIKDTHHVYQTDYSKEFKPYQGFAAKTDIEMKGHIGGGGGEVSAGFDIILVAD